MDDSSGVVDSRKSDAQWKEMFPSEPFEVEDFSKVELDIKYEQKSEYNLVASAERQREFYYNVSLPHYKDDDFLKNAIERLIYF